MIFLLRMLMRKGRGGSMDPLHVSMTGVRMGERFLQIGVHDKALLAGLAAKVGLSGTSAVAALDEGDAKRARAIGAKVGALIEVHDIDAGRAWPIADGEFDMVVVDDSQDTFWAIDQLGELLHNALGALRPGGRIEVVTIVKSAHQQVDFQRRLEEAGFKPVRILAERGRLRFVEGLRGNNK
jgi:SAM-dependent methyltransferase